MWDVTLFLRESRIIDSMMITLPIVLEQFQAMFIASIMGYPLQVSFYMYQQNMTKFEPLVVKLSRTFMKIASPFGTRVVKKSDLDFNLISPAYIFQALAKIEWSKFKLKLIHIRLVQIQVKGQALYSLTRPGPTLTLKK